MYTMSSKTPRSYAFRVQDKQTEDALETLIQKANKRGIIGATTSILQDAINLWLNKEGLIDLNTCEEGDILILTFSFVERNLFNFK